MKKKRIGVLLIISLVIFICIGAISAADTNDTVLEDVSDTDIATNSVAFEEDNATSLGSETGSDVELSVNDDQDEISNQKVGDTSSNLNKGLLSASNADLLKENPNFYYKEKGKWYGDLDDAVSDACENGGGTILLTARAWGYDSAERGITISDGVWITFQPYNSGDTVIFDGQGNDYWFFEIDDASAHITFKDITFRNGGAFQGGAIAVVHGSLTLDNCKFENNNAYQNLGGGFGWGGAIFLDESDASLIAKNCRFTNNNAASGGGAVYVEDGATATFNNCYFDGNKAAGSANHVQDEDSSSSHSFFDCQFIGSGSLNIDVEVTTNTVHINPDVNDDVNYAVLYKNGEECGREPCSDGDIVTFSNLEKGTYTVYMMKNWEAKYEYAGNTFSLITPSFVLDGVQVFETLRAAVNAIPSGGSGVITVEGGTYTDSANFYVDIMDKTVTIMPKDSLNHVIFSPNSQQNYLLYVSPNSQLTMEHITMMGDMSSALLIYSNRECTISNCEFKNIAPFKSSPGKPIYANGANLVLDGNTFESNGRMYLVNTVVNIDDCTFTSNNDNNGQGGAIYADSSSNVTVTNSEFTYNQVFTNDPKDAKGGAIYATKLKVDNTKFIGNGAELGAAIYIAGDSNDPVNITNCVFDSNVATKGYRHIYSESATRIFNLEFNEYDVNIKIDAKDGSYGEDYILEGDFDWGSNLDNNYTFLTGTIDDGDVVGDLVNIEDSRFKINIGVLSGGTHEFAIIGMFAQEDSNDYFYTHGYHSDLYGNQFYIDKDAYAKILIDKANITLTLDVKDVLIPETPVLNVEANWDLNYTIFIGNKYYQIEVKNGKGSMPLTGLDLGNYTVVGMRDEDGNFSFVMSFTSFSIGKTYSNFLVLSTNVEYDTLTEAVANSNEEDTIYIKNGTYADTGIIISDKDLDIIALNGAVFDAQGHDANFIIVNENAMVDIYGVTFKGLRNRNTNYGAIVNYGYLSLNSCNFIDNKITKTSFAQNGGAAIFNNGYSLEIDNCNFINNVAPLKVSTAAVTSLSYEDVSISSSKFINNSAREGGALHFKNISQFEAAVSSCEFEQNIAVKGSAIYVGNNSRYLTVTLSNFKKNDIKNNFGENAQLEGGVIYVNAGTSEVTLDIGLSTFENNSNKNVDGGVICLDGFSKANIESCTFNNNKGNAGSVILIKNPYNKKKTLFIEGSNFINNDAKTGAIETSPKVTTLIDECLFANNTGENRHIYSNGFTVVHDSIFEVKDAKLNALSVKYGESSIISGTADFGTNLYAAANLTVADENVMVEIKDNSFSYNTGILNHGKYYAVLNNIEDTNNNIYLMASITEIFRVNNIKIDFDVSVDNITYGETLKVVETLPQGAIGAINYQLNGNYYTKDELEALKLDAGNYTLAAIYDHEDFAYTYSIVNFEVYKANPTISVADVEVEYGDSIILNIETNVPSIYIIEIEDYEIATLVNGSRSVEIEKIFAPGNYTIKVTSQERVNYISNSTDAILKVNKNLYDFRLSVSDKISYPDDVVIEVSSPDDAVGNITYAISDSNKNIVYTITQSCKDNLIIPGLDAGIYEINAVFEGDDLYNSTDDIQLSFMVYPGEVDLTLQFNDITCGEDLVITPQFDKQNVEGDITYVVGENIKTLPADESYVLSGLDEGNYNVMAIYMGCGNYNSCKFLGTVTVRKSNSLLGAYNNIYGQSLMAPLSLRQFEIDGDVSNEENSKSNAKNVNILSSPENNILGDEYDEYNFLYQYDEDSDYEYYETLEDAIDNVILYGAGIITVRGGTYYVSSMDIEGEVELTIRAYEDEEVIFDCGGDDYFMLLTYDTEMEWVQVPPPPHPEFEQTDGPTVTLENITVINGYAKYGGAIDLEAGTLILTNCSFRNNYAYDEGGAIYIGKWDAEYDAMLIAVNTTFINNYAESEGGAIYIASDNWDGQSTSASFYLCTFLDNYQGEDDEKVINYFAGGNVEEITSQYCIFNGNGTIYTFEMDKINQTVTVNGTSTDVFDSVVLLYFNQVPLYTIYNNGSRDFYITFEDVMGGNYTLGTMNDHNFNTYIFDVTFEMKVPNFIISEDEVYENLTDAIDAVGENGIIYANENYYTEENMEIDIRKSFTLKNFKNRDVVFDGCGEKWFFTIAEGCTVVFDGIYFTDGAVKTHATIENYGNLIIDNCSFNSFETGAIVYNSGLLNILNSEFSLNFVENALVWNDGQLFIETVEFSNNIVNISSAVYNNGVAEIVSSNFTSNSNGGNGGAIYSTNSLSVKGTVFNENEGKDGGAIYNIGILQVLNSTFEDNSANGYGGAIFNGNEANIFDSTFTGGFSEKDGGAIYNNHTMTINNSTFVGNSATGIGGAIYNSRSLVLTKSFFGINFADEFANIYNAGDIQFSENTFDFYDVILVVPDGQYGIPTTITGTLNPEFNMDIQATLPGFVNNENAQVTISDGVFEYVTDILEKGIYDVKLDEIIYDIYGNVYYGELITDRLIINKANVYINLTVVDVILPGSPVLKIDVSKNGLFYILFNNKLSNVTINDGHATIPLEAVGEGNYTVFVAREGDENYNDAANTTSFTVKKYEGKFIVNSTGNEFETLREALADSKNEDIIYVREGTYSGADNLGLTISNKKLTIISLGDVVFDANSADLTFLEVYDGADVTICDVVITGFNPENYDVIYNSGILTFDGCTFVNNIFGRDGCPFIYSTGKLSIVDSGFYDNIASYLIKCDVNTGSLIINESTFENNTINSRSLISLNFLESAKVISNVFAENKILSQGSIIDANQCRDVLISSAFYNNTQSGDVINAYHNTNMLVDNSIFSGNTFDYIINSDNNNQITISGCIFTDNAVNNVVLSKDKNLSVLESTFSTNTLSADGALNIASEMNASVKGSMFTNNNADKYRNIYSVCALNISNSVFDALDVDYSVYDIDYGQTETIEGSIDIGTNLDFTVNLEINSNVYSVNVTDNKFTYNSGVLNGGDYNVVLIAKDNNLNTYLFDKITRIFTVNRIDPGLSISIEDITQGEKLKINLTIGKNVKAHVVYELNGTLYNKNQLENLTLKHGNYLVIAKYLGDINYLPATAMDNVEVYKITPNITVSDAEVKYTDEIKINVTVDVADYYTVFLGNESVSLYVEDSAIFTFSSLNFKPGSYEIVAYVFETDDYAEAYGYATLTVNSTVGFFELSNDIIKYGENATITVKVPVNAYGNIRYRVYNKYDEIIYITTQSCLEELVIPNLGVGRYVVLGDFEGDSYYTKNSEVEFGMIFVNTEGVDLNIFVSNITYGENATVIVESNVDGDYLVYVGNEPMIVTVAGGIGNVSVSNLSAGSYVVNVTIIDSNYSAVNETVFEVVPISVFVVISVEDIEYGEGAVAIVEADVDGEYIVEVCGQNYIVNVDGGKGNTTISDLSVNDDILASVTISNGNYSGYNNTTFNVVPKQIPVIISVENIAYGDDAVVIVEADVDGEYIVDVCGQNYIVNVDGGKGNTTISDLTVNDDILASVTISNGNYSGCNNTTFNVVPKQIPVIISVEDIEYGEDAVVIVVADVDGEYIVYVENEPMIVTVTGGVGHVSVSNLSVGNYVVNVTIIDGNYSAFNETEFEVSPKSVSVVASVEYIEYGEDANVNVVILPEYATGNVTVTINNKTYNATVEEGVAVIVIPGLPAGIYNDVKVLYSGDTNCAPGSTTVNITVVGGDSDFELVVIDPLIVPITDYLKNVTLMVTINETATGNVSLYLLNGFKSLGNYTVEEAKKGMTISDLQAGYNTIIAVYSGDNNFNESFDAAIILINPIVPEISMEATGDFVVDGKVNVTVTVPEDFNGTVSATIDGAIAIADLVDGKYVIPFDSLAAGNHTVAVYLTNDTNYVNATDSISFSIAKVDPTIDIAVDGSPVIGELSYAYITLPEDATGYIIVGDGMDYDVIDVYNSTMRIYIRPALTQGNSITVRYSGDDKYNKGNASILYNASKENDYPMNATDDSIAYGENAVIIVSLPDDATGNVTVTINGETYSDVVEYGIAVIVVPGLAVGNYTNIEVLYTGDDTYSPGKATANIYVTPGDSGFDVVPDAAEIGYGESTVFEIVIDENATGNIEYFWYDSEEDEYISIFNQSVEEARESGFEVIHYSSGMNLFIASYSGDGSFLPADAAFAVKVNKIVLTNGDVHRLGSMSIYGYNSSVVLVMEDEFSDATGNITLVYYDIQEGYIYYNGTVENGQGIIILPVMDVGEYGPLPFIYSGDDKYEGLTTTVGFVVFPIKTEMSVVPSENNKVGDVANVTVTVGPAYPIDPSIVVHNLTGTVDVYVDGNLVAGGAELVNGAVIVPVEGLAAGNHTVAVYYGGDDIYDESVGNATLKVDKVDPKIVIDDIAASVGETVEVNVTIDGGDATGYLFFDGELYIVENGQTTISFVIEHAGMQAITVTYLGDDKYNNGIGVKAFNAGKAAPEVEANVPIEAYVGEDVVVEVTVSPEDATGTVTVYVDGEEYVTCDVDDEVIITGLANGTHVIGVKYNGNINYNASEVVEYTIVVNRNNLTDVVIFVPETEYGENTTVVVILPEDSTGTVTVTVNDSEYTADVENGVAKVNIPALDAGKYDDVPVAYSGDGKYSPYENTTSFEVDSQYVDWGALISSEEIDINETVIISYDPIVDEGIGYVLPDDCVVYIKVNGEDYGNYTSEQFKEGIVVDAFSEYGTYTVTVGIADDPNYTFAEPIDYTVAVLRDSKINVTVPSDIKAGNNATIIISIPNATGIVIVSVDGNETPVPLVDGVAYFTMDNVTVGPHSVLVTYPGDDANSPAYTIVEVTVPRINTYIEVDKTFTRNATDYNAGERGAFFYAVLKDENGNLLVNKTVAIAVNGPIYYVTTDDQGRAGLQVNLASANTYTYALSFVGDDEYNAAPLACTKLLVIKKKTSIVASAASFKSTAKTKIVTATLKTIKNAYDGKTYLKAGKELKLTIDGKTYKATAGANGVVKFNIGSFTKKGTFNAAIKFAGDRTYESAIKTIKITIS